MDKLSLYYFGGPLGDMIPILLAFGLVTVIGIASVT